MANGGSRPKDSAVAVTPTDEDDRFRKRLQRIIRSPEIESPHLSGGIGSVDPRSTSARFREAKLSPRLASSSSIIEEEEPQYQCTDCDMIVRESDPYCPFCGAIFADGPLALAADSEKIAERPLIEKPVHREPMTRPEKFDLFSLLKTKSRSREMLYQEAQRGFSGSARLLEEVEHLVSDLGALGKDTAQARRLIESAWEACRDGNWNLVSALAHQTEEMIEPSIPDLVRSEIGKARELLADAKAAGVDISKYVVRVKNAMQALRTDDPDEALRITKELMDSLREDSISWNRIRPAE